MRALGRVDSAVVREAFTLPLLFSSVALAGGLRIGAGGTLSFVPPQLMALVLAVMLIAALFRSGVLIPDRLMRPERAPVENASGLVVLLTLFAATAQTLHLVTPEAGLLAFTFNVVWIVLIGNTIAARPDRPRLLASLLVVFGAAFVVKYVVLGALYAPDGGITKRVVLALLDGVTLGGLAYQAPGPLTGYVAFAACAAFLIGLALLPGPRRDVQALVPVDARPRPPARGRAGP